MRAQALRVLSAPSVEELARRGTAYLVAWTEQRGGKGRVLDVGVYSEPTPTSYLDGRNGFPHTLVSASSECGGYHHARAELYRRLRRQGLTDTLSKYTSFHLDAVRIP